MLGLSSAAFLQICCAHYGYQKEWWRSIKRYLAISDAFTTGRLKTTTCFTQTVFSMSCPSDRYTTPSVSPYVLERVWSRLPWALTGRWIFAINIGGGSSPSVPDAWVKSVSSGQCCHCWLSQGCLKGLFPIVFPRTCPKMFPSKPPSRRTPAEELRTIAHKVPSSIAISRISAVTVN